MSARSASAVAFGELTGAKGLPTISSDLHVGSDHGRSAREWFDRVFNAGAEGADCVTRGPQQW